MEFLRFIFSSFWVWLGFVILVSMTGGGVIELVKACKRNRKVTAYRIGDRWHVEVENATKDEAKSIMITAAYRHLLHRLAGAGLHHVGAVGTGHSNHPGRGILEGPGKHL